MMKFIHQIKNMENITITKQLTIYNGGHMLDTGSQLIRNIEKEKLLNIGAIPYLPQDDGEINDKATATLNGLAEKIVKKDSKAIMDSDVIILDIQSFALGTITELGQVLGMRDLAEKVLEILYQADNDPYVPIKKIESLVLNILKQKVYCQCTDIRRQTTEVELMDRKSFSTNQYVYGAVLKVTNGKGFMEFNDIIEKLKKHAEAIN